MTYGSVCSGIEAATAAWEPLGWTPAWFSEIETFPSRVLQYHYPHVPNLGDMTKLKDHEHYNNTDISLLVGGTPCFSSDTLVLTNSGMKEIKDVIVGDLVLTHKNRWRPVLKTGSKLATTLVLKGQGAEVTTTSNHRFYARETLKVWDNDKRRYVLQHQPLKWIEARDMLSKRWSIPVMAESLPIPSIVPSGRERSEIIDITPEVLYVAGRWLGDGWCRINERRGYAIICCSYMEDLSDRLRSAGFNFSVSNERTTKRYQIANRAFARWLVENFGEKALGKYVPGWVFGMQDEKLQQLFNGYIDADGTCARNGYKSTSISAKLSYSMAMIGARLGFTYSIIKSSNNRKCIIEGRQVNESTNYVVSYYANSRSAFFEEGFMHGLVRKSEQTNKSEIVYDLEVEEDHSYTANGIAVHNCQSFSIAGLRGGMADDRGNLALEYCRILLDKQPRWFVWENVPGVFSSFTDEAAGADNFHSDLEPGDEYTRDITESSDFATLLTAFRECGYSVAYRVLDSRYFGVPQRRRRVFVVGYLGDDWRPPAAVLFERESLRWDLTPSGSKGEETAGTLEARTRGGGFPGSDGAMSGHVVATLDANYGKLQGCSGQDLNHGHSHLVVYGGNNTSGHLSVSPSLNAHGSGRYDFETEAIVVQGYTIHGTDKTASVASETDTHSALRSRTPGGIENSTTTVVVQSAAFMAGQGEKAGGIANEEECSPTLKSGASGTNLAPTVMIHNKDGNPSIGFNWQEGMNLKATIEETNPLTKSQTEAVYKNNIVRRLTPLECERLQGLRDGHTDIPGAADTPRYASIGNSMTKHVMAWLGSRIDKVDKLLTKLGPHGTP